MPPHRIARFGIGFCPEERGIFASLNCEENLLLPPACAGRHAADEIYEMFPNLRERRASPGTQLSGGEQQMLAIARILRTGAQLLLLDETSEGLAPVIVQQLGAHDPHAARKGFTIVMVEQNFRFAAPSRTALRDGARPHRRRFPAAQLDAKHGHAARISGCLTSSSSTKEIDMKRKLSST